MFSLKTVARQAVELLPNKYIKDDNIIIKDGMNNIATAFDVKVQEFIVSEIRKSYPTASLLCEEDLSVSGDGITFVIDPIDGTANFYNNIKFSCISIAKLVDGVADEAVVYNPYLDEMFYAKAGQGAWLNDERLCVNDTELKNSIVGFTQCPYDSELTDAIFEFGKILFENSIDFRRMGAAALEICYAACNRYQLYCEMILYPWDYIAAGLIVKEAGGIVTDLNGEELSCDRRCSVVAGCATAHSELLKLYGEFKINTKCCLEAKTTLY